MRSFTMKPLRWLVVLGLIAGLLWVPAGLSSTAAARGEDLATLKKIDRELDRLIASKSKGKKHKHKHHKRHHAKHRHHHHRGGSGLYAEIEKLIALVKADLKKGDGKKGGTKSVAKKGGGKKGMDKKKGGKKGGKAKQKKPTGKPGKPGKR